MTTLIAVLLILMILLLTLGMFMAYTAWQKVETFLTWNTRYEQAEYETSIQKPKIKRPHLKASKVENKGRIIKDSDELVDITDLPIEQAMSIVEELGNG